MVSLARPSLRLLVASICLLAFALRVYTLDAQEIWGDEAFSIATSQLPITTVLSPGVDTHPPLYYFLLHLWGQVAGFSVFAVRFLSVWFSVLLTPLAFALGRQIAGARVGFVAALLLALSPYQIFYAQETRMYALAGALAALSMWLHLRLIHQPVPSRPTNLIGCLKSIGSDCLKSIGSDDFSRLLRAGEDQRTTKVVTTVKAFTANSEARLFSQPLSLLIGYVLSSLFALYAHYFFGAVLLAQNLMTLAIWRSHWRRLAWWITGQGAIALGYLPWVVSQAGYLGGMASARIHEWGPDQLVHIFVETLRAFSAGAIGDAFVLNLAAAVGAALMAWGLIALFRQATAKIYGPWLGLWLLLPTLLAYAAGPFLPFFHERFIIVGAPPAALLMAMGAAHLGRGPGLSVLATLAICVLVAAPLPSWYRGESYVKGQYATAMRYIAQRAQPGDVLLLNNPFQIALYEYYRPEKPQGRLLTAGEVLTPERTDAALSQVTAGADRAWLVTFGDLAVHDPHGHVESWLARRGFRSDYQSYATGVAVALYDLQDAERVEVQSGARFGAGIRLERFVVGTRAATNDRLLAYAQAGEALRVRLHWLAEESPAEDYTVTVQVLNERSELVAQMDSQPQGGVRPTSSWQAGERIEDGYGVALPADLPPGEYSLRVGLYTWPDLERLPVWEPGRDEPADSAFLGIIVVE